MLFRSLDGMAKTFLSADLTSYVLDHSVKETPLLRRLRDETLQTSDPQMQITPDQGKFLSLLIKMIGAVNTIEIGVFTGYSSICVAQSLPPHGKIIACDVSEKWTSVARRYWKEAGLAEKIDLRLAPAVETLALLQKEGRDNFFDFVFIDADKENLLQYYERSISLVRSGGVIAIDNTLRNGDVLNTSSTDSRIVATRALNDAVIADSRVDTILLPVWDGLTLAVKR